MWFVDIHLPDLAMQLALDEALLEMVESAGPGSASEEVFRLWEAPSYGVVLGRSSQTALELQPSAWQEKALNIQRRVSGGATVVVGPGCLMYTLVLSYVQRPELRDLTACHRWVMTRLQAALNGILPGVEWQGTCDLVYQGRKFSGNALRCRRNALLYHGTLLYNFPLEKVSAWLREPPRQPEYREQRLHTDFVGNFPVTAEQLNAALRRAWPVQPREATVPLVASALTLAQQLVQTRYSRPNWVQEGRS